MSKKHPGKNARTAAASRQRSQCDLIATAHHEAGHAVIALVVGYPINTLSIVPNKRGDLGTCGHPSPALMHNGNRRDARRAARDCILISYAGIPAQRLVDSKPEPFHGDGDADSAFRVSCNFGVFPRHMQYVGDDSHRTYLETLRREAERLVRRHAGAVRHLAAVLLTTKTMTGENVEATLVKFDLVR